MRKIVIGMLIVLILGMIAGAYGTYVFLGKESDANLEVRIVNNQEYYNSLIADIANSKERILVAMHEIKYDIEDQQDEANDLTEELVNAKNRGVYVEVVIEYVTHEDKMDINLAAYNYLNQSQVNVRLDRTNTTDHMKLVVIDDSIVYVGSHNWSESALHYNSETSVRLTSATIAQTYTQYFDNLWQKASSS